MDFKSIFRNKAFRAAVAAVFTAAATVVTTGHVDMGTISAIVAAIVGYAAPAAIAGQDKEL